MSEPTLRPIWTPDDARQTAIDAAKHSPHLGVSGSPDDSMADEAPLPFRRNVKTDCPCCGAWPLEECESGCLSRMTPEQQQQHRNDVIDGVLAYLDTLEANTAPRFPVDYHTQAALYRTNGMDRTPAVRRRARVVIAALVLVLVLALGGIWLAGRASAEPMPSNCQQQPWLYGGLFGRWTTRTICDEPIHADGTWLRHRNFYAQSYYKPFSCSGGTYSWSCNGGYQVPEFDTGVEEYVVAVDTVLPDEPGHLA